jgi:hypothetical protein
VRINLGLFAVFSLIILMIIPAHADVTSATLDKESFSIDDKFTILGTNSDEGGIMLVASMKGENGESLNRNAYSSGGTFTFTPVNADDLFDREGTYTFTIFTEYQQPINGTVIKIEYDDGIATILPDFELILKSIGNKQVDETEKLSFTASITDSQITDKEFSLDKQPSGAIINKDTGAFSWTPTDTQAGGYIFDIVVNAGPLQDRETITVTVTDKPVTTPTEPEEIVCPQGMEPVDGKCPDKPVVEEPKELGIASFVDETKDPQSYVDRYNTEATYKKWFDENFAEYDSIYQAVGLEEMLLIPAVFVDETKDPQSYVDRYNNEATYKKWFDENFAEYDSIYQAIGLEEPKVIAPFVDSNLDPQYYIDRYNTEATYKKWFDENFADYDSIYQAVGLEEPIVKEKKFGICGPGTNLIDGICTIVEKPVVKPWWKFW